MYLLEIVDSRPKTKFAQFAQMLDRLTQVVMSRAVIVCGGRPFAHSLLVCPKIWRGKSGQAMTQRADATPRNVTSVGENHDERE